MSFSTIRNSRPPGPAALGRRRPQFAIFLLVQLVFALLLLLPEGGAWQQAKDGVMDLSSWDERLGDIVPLNGEWAFYWGALRTAEEIRGKHTAAAPPDLMADIPNEWNGYDVNGARLTGEGRGTYRLTVHVREPGIELALKALPLSTAYTIFVDDRLLMTNGTPAETKAEFVEEGRPRTARFIAPAETFDLIAHIANFDYAKGGMNRPLLLGSPEALERTDRALIFKDLFLLGGLVIAFFYSVSMYILNREEKISLFFGLVCLIFLFRIPLSSSYLIYEWIPAASLRLTEWINYTTFHAGVLFYALFIREFFSDLFSDRVRRLLTTLTAAIVLSLLALPIHVYTQYYLLSDALGFAVLAYPCYIIIKAAIRRKPYSWLILTGNSMMVTMVAVDIVNTELNRYEMGFFSNFGMFLFLFLYAFILAMRFTLSFRDSTSLSRKLLELDKLKDEFLANTSHELKTPLHGIIGITESLMDGAEGPLNRSQLRNLKLVASSGRRLTHLINDILDFSKLRHQDIILHKKHVQLKPLAEFVLAMCRHTYARKPITWKMSLPDELPPVYADENRLVQILYNLAGNSGKFTERGEVVISASERNRGVEISVVDTGVGISSDRLEDIFHPFIQVDASTERANGGVGLGLSITKHLVELHGGRIEASSAPGAGARFSFTLPAGPAEDALPPAPQDAEWAAVAETAAHAAAAEPPAAVTRQGEHILIADDDPANLLSAFNLLKLEGYSVTAVTNGTEALAAVRSRPDIRLAVLDVMMPAMSGYEVCRAIRETKSGAELPVLLVTAMHRTEDLVLGFQSGANDYLAKPYEPLEFKARVRTLIELNASVRSELKSEAAFLQAQIKPHFIYNTLNTISYFCLRDGEQANSLLENFSEYLRASFDFKHMEDLVPLAKELDFVRTYVGIEHVRFEERLQTVFDIDEALMPMKIPPLILQPLVENAIVHGAMKKLEGGTVSVKVEKQGDEVLFTVKDTGVGMSEKRLDSLLKESPDVAGVGLRNIHKRLKSLYGSGIRIASVEGAGTEVSFAIPAP